MGKYSEEHFTEKKNSLMEKCFECFAEEGLYGTGIRVLGRYCGCNSAIFYTFFKDLDTLILESTAYGMKQVEKELMNLAPADPAELEDFIDKVPYFMTERHGKKYRLMYQVFMHPRYIAYGREFYRDADKRLSDYAEVMADKIGLSAEIFKPIVLSAVRAGVHFALFGDEGYMKDQMKWLKNVLKMARKAA